MGEWPREKGNVDGWWRLRKIQQKNFDFDHFFLNIKGWEAQQMTNEEIKLDYLFYTEIHMMSQQIIKELTHDHDKGVGVKIWNVKIYISYYITLSAFGVLTVQQEKQTSISMISQGVDNFGGWKQWRGDTWAGWTFLWKIILKLNLFFLIILVLLATLYKDSDEKDSASI
jgi:preprotein translocase subunit SecG